MSDTNPASHAPRIAIKFGSTTAASPKTTSTGSRKSNPPQSTLGKRPWPHALGGDSESEDDENVGKIEAVTGFGSNGAESKTAQKGNKGSTSSAGAAAAPFVIGGHKNKDWKAEIRSRGGKDASYSDQGGRPSESFLPDTESADQENEIQWGLSTSKSEPREANSPPKDTALGAADAGLAEEAPKDETQDAIDALMGKRRKVGQDIVISSNSTQAKGTLQASEEDSYRRAVEAAAEVSTIDEYDQIPDGEFGAAMLRGMGWKGEERAPKAKEIKRRPQFMGLGAKEDKEIKQAEAAKKHGYRDRRPRLEEYRSSKDRERRDREDRHRDSYKSERDRERYRDSHDRRSSDRDRDRDRHRHNDRHSRR